MNHPLNEQVVVITGASSGIGRATALAFGEAGAQVVLAARNEQALLDTAIEIQQAGGTAMAVPTDVSDAEQVQALANAAVEAFGRIDTWVNNAGVSIYATTEDTTEDEAQRIMQVNFFGMVHGVNAVLPIMKAQGGGTIINVGSIESQRALPLQSVYAASKHAVRGYTEALRMEQMHAKTGVNVTLIMPSGINTPLFEHARSKTGYQARPMPPAYQPELAAAAIVNAAAMPQRDIIIGGTGAFFSLVQKLTPGLFDRFMVAGGLMYHQQMTKKPASPRDNLFETVPGGKTHGEFESITKRSFYTPVVELGGRMLRPLLILSLPAALVISAISRRRQPQPTGLRALLRR